MRDLIVVAVCMVLSLPLAVAGNNVPAMPADTFYIQSDTMNVNARRTRTVVEEVVPVEVIEAVRMSRTADDLLTNTAGVDVQRSSPGGSRGRGVTIRGFDESRALILLNGRPLNGTGVMGGHYVDWSSISTEDIERIEVGRGAKSAEYGNTLGGVVNIVTKKGSGTPRTRIAATYGSFNTLDATVSHQGVLGSFLFYDFAAGHWQTDGYLRNNNVDRNTVSGRLTFALPHNLVVELGGRVSLHERGFIIENSEDDPAHYDADYPESEAEAGGGPGIKWKNSADSTFGDGSYWYNVREQYDLCIRHFIGDFAWNAHAYLNDQHRTEYFYARTDEDHLIYERFAKPEDNTCGWQVQACYDVAGHSLKAGTEGSYLNYDGTKINEMDSSYFKSIPTESEDTDAAMRHGAFLQDRWTMADNAALDAGLRYDAYRGNERDETVEKTECSGISPKAGIDWRAWRGGTVRIDAGRALRFPSCPELYWYYGGYDPASDSIARKELGPEDAWQYEAGVAQKIGTKADLEIRGYHYDVTDYIRTIFGYKPSRVVYNIDRVTFIGMECEARYVFFKCISLTANYTYQITEKEGDILDLSSALTDNLPELPEHKGNIMLSYAGYRGLKARLKCRILGERQVITGNLTQVGASALEAIDASAVVSLQGAYPVYHQGRMKGTLRLGVDNLLNTEYEEEYGFPMPGITVNGGVDIEF